MKWVLIVLGALAALIIVIESSPPRRMVTQIDPKAKARLGETARPTHG
jgi:hypothetical protein